MEEQVDVKTVALESEAGQAAKDQVAMQSSFIGLVSGGISAIPEAEKAQFEEEKMKLYQQLDDKVTFVCHIYLLKMSTYLVNWLLTALFCQHTHTGKVYPFI